MTDKMPRVVQTIDTNEEDSINANTNKCERSDGHLNLAEGMDRGSKGRIILYDDVTNIEEEESLYSLRCVIDGKVKRFKKDTRVWLHKSSTKCKRKPEQNLTKLGGAEIPRKLVKFEDDQNASDLHKRVNEKLSDVLEEDPNLSQTELSGTFNKFYGKRLEIVSDLSSLGDSDADLTYSEATTPTKTCSSCEDSEPTIVSQSSTSLVTNDVTSQDDIRLADFYEPKLNDDLNESSESLEVLDLCNQSTNSTQSYPTQLSTNLNIECCPSKFTTASHTKTSPTIRTVPRQLAPAIDIEDESIRENLLDYCVNLKPEDRDQTQCVANRTRSASKSRGAKTSSNSRSKSQRLHTGTQKNSKSKRIIDEKNNKLKTGKIVSSPLDPNSLQIDSFENNKNRTLNITRGFQSDERPGCSTQQTIMLPMSLLCLATLALLKDTTLGL